MRKCRSSEVSTVAIALAKECAAGVQFNWSQFLCEEFLANCREVQEEGKLFYNAWLLLSLMLVTTELPDDSQFPVLTLYLLEAMQYASLKVTKDASRIQGIKIFWVLMDMTICQCINTLLRLTNDVYKSMKHCRIQSRYASRLHLGTEGPSPYMDPSLIHCH